MAKVAVSLPQATLQALERARRASGRSRSSIVAEAIDHWLRDSSTSSAERAYVRGYLEQPEGEGAQPAIAQGVIGAWEAWD